MNKIIFKRHKNANIQKILIGRLEKQGVHISLECLEEDLDPSEYMYSERDLKWIEKQQQTGNEYAWFCAKIKVQYGPYETQDYLGCCSYLSEEDFKMDGYYADMVYSCVREINEQIQYDNLHFSRSISWDVPRLKIELARLNLPIPSTEKCVELLCHITSDFNAFDAVFINKLKEVSTDAQ